MDLPYRPSVRLVNNPQPLIDGTRHGSLTLKAEPLPIGRNPRGRLWAVTVFFAPIFIFAVELGGLGLGVRFLDAPVLDEEGGHVVMLPELLGSVLDAGGDLEVTALPEAPQTFEGPVENPGSLGRYGPFDLRIALVLVQRRESHDLNAPEEPRVRVRHPRKLVHGPAYFCLRYHGERVVVLALNLERLTGDDGVERVGRGEV